MRFAPAVLIASAFVISCTQGKRSGRLAQPIKIAVVAEPGLSRAVMDDAAAKLRTNATVVKEDIWSAASQDHKVYYFQSDFEVDLRDAIKAVATGTRAGQRAAGQSLVFEPLMQEGFRSHLIINSTALTITALRSAHIQDSPTGVKEIVLKLTEADREEFHEFTKAHVAKKLVFMIGDRVHSTPVLMEPIPGGSIMLSLSPGDDAKALMQSLFGPEAP